MPAGWLVATVLGTKKYTVLVRLLPDKTGDRFIDSICTCPVRLACKHAVATVAAYLELLGRGEQAPAFGKNDRRLNELQDLEEPDDDDLRDESEFDFDDDGDYEEDEQEEDDRPSSRPSARRKSGKNWDAKIRSNIDAMSKKELSDLVWSLVERFPEVHQEFRERIALGEGDADKLLKQARQELRRVVSEPGWSDHWSGRGYTPDYSGLKHRLERMSEMGFADAVVRLGPEIIEQGMEQIGQSQDEGETGEALEDCLRVVFKAVEKSSLPPEKKLLFLIDADLADEYDVIGHEALKLIEGDFKPQVWSEVAAELTRRLEGFQLEAGERNHSSSYRRDRLSNWLAHALRKANREGDMLAVYENEARKTKSYERLVQLLIERKDYERAEKWAREGITETVDKLPGIASSLAKSLTEIARRRRQWDAVAAFVAWEFFEQPSVDGYEKLAKAAKRAGCEAAVRRLALRFLETGAIPGQDDGWPLPLPDYIETISKSERRSRRTEHPHYDVLIDRAIAARKPDEVLKWYDQMCASRSSQHAGFWHDGAAEYSNRVARAVQESHPERTLGIYHQRLKESLVPARQSAYEAVGSCLLKMKPVFKTLGREAEWGQLVADIRLRHRNRPKLMEVLDGVEGKAILRGK